MEIGFLPGLFILGVGLFAAFLGLTGRIRYGGQASCTIGMLIFIGIAAIVSAVADFLLR